MVPGPFIYFSLHIIMSGKYDICDNFHIHVPKGATTTKKYFFSNKTVNAYCDRTDTVYNNTGTKVSTSSTKKHSTAKKQGTTKKNGR